MLSLVSVASDDSQRGAVMGTFTSSASLARVIGPIAAGALYDVAIPAPFVLAAGFLVFAALLGVRLPPDAATLSRRAQATRA